MKYSAWIGLLAVITVMIVCCVTWVYVPSAQLQIGGLFSSSKHNLGKPGLMNIICSTGAGILFILPRIWAKRTNIFCCGFNLAWALRNYILLSRCYLGDCPVKKAGLYILLAASVMMLIMALLPDTELKDGGTGVSDREE